ncbi:hypothetical protein [Bifidobacterium breve]|uniref:hypothetical protein n=1 Tax=Bifidobacterium breve TaxID=1685 RepID=UPI0030F3DC82
MGRYLDLVAAFDSSVMHDTSGGKAGQQYTPAGDWIRKRDYDSLAELKQSEKDKEAQARAEQRNTVKKWAITLGIGLGISLIALIMAIFRFVRVRLAVRSRDAMYVHDIPQIGPVSVARIASIMGLAPKHGYDHRQTAATLLSLAAKGAIAIYPGPASLYGGVELTGLAANAAVGFAGGESDAEWERGCGFGALGPVSCLCHGDGHVQTNAAGTCQSISADSEP